MTSTPLRHCLVASSLALAAFAAPAQQQPIGSVALADATVGSASSVADGRATLAGSGTVTAKDHPADVTLVRGGQVRVCSTSGLHVTAGTTSASTAGDPAGSSTSTPPLLLALDRGAMEVRMTAIPGDVVMTPDLRLSLNQPGPLDLRIRVTPNGDTCVENSVPMTEAPSIAQAKAQAETLQQGPTLSISSLFGDDAYEVHPGQRVLFEHGSLHEVVDHETSACGCPPPLPPVPPPATTLALAPGEKTSPDQAAALHPFPAAVSQGLAPAPPVPQADPSQTHAQASTTLTFSAATPPARPAAPLPTPPSAPKPGIFHRLGHFFRRLF